MNTFIPIPQRTVKPRSRGLTMVIDSNLGTRAVEDLIEVGKDIVDYVKLGWGTALVTPNLKAKIELYLSHDIQVCLGGTFFELAFLHHKLQDYLAFLRDYGISMIEISDGTIDIPRSKKLFLIEQFAKEFKVLSEYGSKDANKEVEAPRHWARHMKEEMEAGAWKVIAEGRESGTAGMYRGNSELRMGLIDEIVETLDPQYILWEAPKKEHQAWFIKKYGPNVNLGNINPKDIIPLETLRLGLRSDTLLTFHTNPSAGLNSTSKVLNYGTIVSSIG